MHVQSVDPAEPTLTCTACGVFQNVEVAWHDEEADLLSGQLCWYCGETLDPESPHTEFFKVVLPGDDVPTEPDDVLVWEHNLEETYGGKPLGFIFDVAGRCVVAMHRVTTTGDLDLPEE